MRSAALIFCFKYNNFLPAFENSIFPLKIMSITTLEKIKNQRDEIYNLANQYGVFNIRIFGSTVRNEDGKDSDIDFLASINKNTSLFKIIKLENILSKIFNKKVQILSDKAVNKNLRHKIFSEASPI
jgi:uncharacterized protein